MCNSDYTGKYQARFELYITDIQTIYSLFPNYI